MSNSPSRFLPKGETASTYLLYDHYKQLGVLYGWDRAKVDELLCLGNVTIEELGRMFCVHEAPDYGKIPNFKLIHRYYADNHFPPTVALHFAEFKNYIVAALARRNGKEPEEKVIIPAGVIIKPESNSREGYSHD